ncbi:hypothetical protein IKQ21_00260 [bacterium]|nr:hypothetical protein [bacterium]
MTNPIDTNGTYYVPRSQTDKTTGFLLATLASGAIMKGLSVTGDIFHKELIKEQSNNNTYREYLNKAFDLSGLAGKGVNIIPAQYERVTFPIEAAGKNACYIPKAKKVVLNTDKISHAGFHELGHAMNDLMSKYGVKYLAKSRRAGYIIAGLMEYFAIFSRTKPKDSKRNLVDIIEDNCGKIAFAALLPVIAEEGIASYRGVKLAKASGLPEHLIKNLKKLYTKALATYAGRAVLGGLAVGASRIIMDHYTRPRKVELDEFFSF